MIDTTDGIIQMRPQLLQAVTAAKASDPKAKGSEFWRRVQTPCGSFKATFVVAANTMRTGPVSPMSLLKVGISPQRDRGFRRNVTDDCGRT